MDGKHSIKEGSVIVLWLLNGYRYSGTVISQTERFLVLEDDRTQKTRVFHYDDVKDYEVLA